MSDNPYPAPAPLTVADLCAQAAWLDDIDDETRLRLEWASETIRFMHARLMTVARKLELAEVCNEKGGAA